MKQTSIILIQAAIVLLGISALVLMLWEPHLEGRNADATLFQVYFNDPFLAYVYVSSIAFFIALYQSLKLLGYIGRSEMSSLPAKRALRTIKYCALSLVGLIGMAEAWLFLYQGGEEDIAGGVAIGLFLILVSALVAATANVFETIQTGTRAN